METMKNFRIATLSLAMATLACAQQYDLLLQGGHVIDARNNLSAVRDVAIKDGKIAAVAAIPGARIMDYSVLPDSTEFTLPELKTYAVIDLSR